METADTICAVSTPSGEGGIGIIRVSGSRAHSLLKTIFLPRTKREAFLPRTLYLGHIYNPATDLKTDEVFAVLLNGPHTYTREDMAEVYSHGGFSTLQGILMLMLAQGARLAEPGEFTKRAFLNGRIDLLQAESVLDIIQSETEEELQCALGHLEGGLSRKIEVVREKLKATLVEIEALIDFPEEDIDVDRDQCLATLRKVAREIDTLVGSYYQGRAIRDGLEVLIIGKPNVGKSSLLNALLLREKAIVTPLPGTTRDLIEDTIHIRGIKIRIVDTAGLRKPRDLIEAEGIDRVRQRIPSADLILLVLDGASGYSNEDEEIRANIGTRNTIVAVNKIDLSRKLDTTLLRSAGLEIQEISALTGEGLEDLKNSVYEKLMGRDSKTDKVLVTNVRHRDALRKTYDAVDRAITGQTDDEPVEFMAFEIRDALHSLGEITGETCPEEVLHDIFARFCIGK